MVKRASDDLKKLTVLQTTLVRPLHTMLCVGELMQDAAAPQDHTAEDLARHADVHARIPARTAGQRRAATHSSGWC